MKTLAPKTNDPYSYKAYQDWEGRFLLEREAKVEVCPTARENGCVPGVPSVPVFMCLFLSTPTRTHHQSQHRLHPSRTTSKTPHDVPHQRCKQPATLGCPQLGAGG